MKARVLIVDDETSMREFLSILIEREGYSPITADCAETALKILSEQKVDLVISDVNMPGLDGIGLLERIKSSTPDTVVMMITAFSTTEQAVEAMKYGAYNYIAKPFKVDEIKLVVRNALEKQQLALENAFLKGVTTRQTNFCGMIGKSKKMLELFQLIEKVAPSSATVMISGESGTGKELAAKAIHLKSDRSDKPFVAVNCGAIPESLMESEFFGHAKGAFTGAVGERPGLFEQASSGTLFLDEIGEVPLLLQAKLLRVIQEREVRRVGGGETRRIDVRIVTATNRDLEQQVREGSFREDLFYRLNVVQISLPSLRERPEDIPLLVDYFLHKYSSGNVIPSQSISAPALEFLWNYHFPGNVRELENLVERAVALGAREITPDSLPQQVIRKVHDRNNPIDIPPVGFDLEKYLDDIEKKFLLQALDKSGGVKKRAADLLGMTFRSFRYKLAKHGMGDD